MADPFQLGISTVLKSRDGTSASKDSRYTNMLIEMRPDRYLFLKRQGYQYLDGSAWPAGPALSTYTRTDGSTFTSGAALGATQLPDGTILSFVTGTGTGTGTGPVLGTGPYATPHISTIATAKFTGGTKTTSGSYTIHTFNTSGTGTSLVNNLSVDYLIVGGGGGHGEGGGGAGGLSYVTGHTIVSASAITVTVGTGGANGNPGVNGGDTTFITTVAGGGGGGRADILGSGQNGGCGGGGGLADLGVTSAGGTGSVGYNGGTGYTDIGDTFNGGGGGGGMGGLGGNCYTLTGQGGDAGLGVQNSISGTSEWYSAGGAGSGSTPNPVTGNDGPGRGAGGPFSGGVNYSAARDGIVIVRYLT